MENRWADSLCIERTPLLPFGSILMPLRRLDSPAQSARALKIFRTAGRVMARKRARNRRMNQAAQRFVLDSINPSRCAAQAKGATLDVHRREDVAAKMNKQPKTRGLASEPRLTRQQGFHGFAGSGLTRLAVCVFFLCRLLGVGLAGAVLIEGACAQTPPASAAGEKKANCENQIRSTYLLGPDDQLDISGPELTDLTNKPVRIDGEGDIQMPLAGSVHVAGLTVQM